MARCWYRYFGKSPHLSHHLYIGYPSLATSLFDAIVTRDTEFALCTGICNAHITGGSKLEPAYTRDRVWEAHPYGTECTNQWNDPYMGYVYGHDGYGPGRYGDDWRYC